MTPTTKDEFFKRINEGKLNVHPDPQGSYPYTTIWKFLDYDKRGQVFGKSVGRIENGLEVQDYFLA